MLTSVDSAVQEPKETVDVELEPERHGEGESVGDDVDEDDRRLQIHVFAQPALVAQRRKQLVAASRGLWVALLELRQTLRGRR
jgi:hypothetical protein